MTITLETARSLATGRGKVYDATGNKIGSIGQVYVDDETGEPNWVTVKTGLFGLSESFVPLEGARAEGVDLHVAASEEQVKAAPRVDPDGSLSSTEEERLYDYYASRDRPDAETRPTATSAADERREQGYPSDRAAEAEQEAQSDRAAEAEQYAGTGERAGEQARSAEDQGDVTLGGRRLRLRKYVVTDEATVTVPVQREEIRLEPETDDSGTSDNPGAADRGER
jgi:hypothetical protein